MSGWIKLHREIFDSDIWHDVTTFRLFLYLLGKASHHDGVKVKGMELRRGQYVRSYRKLADDLSYKEGRGFKKYSLSTIKKCVNKLIESERVNVEETELGTLFTIINYARYQDSEGEEKRSANAINEEVQTNSELMANELRTNGEQEQELKNLRIKELNTTTKENDPVDIIAQKFIELRTIHEGRPVYPKTKDYEAITRVVARGMPLPQTIQLLEQCFEEYKERNSDGAIKAFSYCEKYIGDHYKALVARDEAIETAKNGVPANKTKPYKPRNGRAKPIRTEPIPEWFDEEEKPSNVTPLRTDDYEQKKRELEERLKKYKV